MSFNWKPYSIVIRKRNSNAFCTVLQNSINCYVFTFFCSCSLPVFYYSIYYRLQWDFLKLIYKTCERNIKSMIRFWFLIFNCFKCFTTKNSCCIKSIIKNYILIYYVKSMVFGFKLENSKLIHHNQN